MRHVEAAKDTLLKKWVSVYFTQAVFGSQYQWICKCMNMQMWICKCEYANVFLYSTVDINEITNSLTLHLVCCVIQSSKQLSDLFRWFPEVQNIFYQGNKSKQITHTHLDAFFNSVSVLMTSQLRSLCMDSILDYQQLYCPPPVSVLTRVSFLNCTWTTWFFICYGHHRQCGHRVFLPQDIVRKNDFHGFIVRLVLEGVDMKFEPSRADFETVLLNVFDVFVKAVSMVPRVETKLYPVEVSVTIATYLSNITLPWL
jgi:dynein heavy chain